MSKTQRAHLRNQKIGFVFQNYNLLAKTTAVENVELPLMYNNKYDARQRREAAVRALQAVGLGAARLPSVPCRPSVWVTVWSIRATRCRVVRCSV